MWLAICFRFHGFPLKWLVMNSFTSGSAPSASLIISPIIFRLFSRVVSFAACSDIRVRLTLAQELMPDATAKTINVHIAMIVDITAACSVSQLVAVTVVVAIVAAPAAFFTLSALIVDTL